MPSPSEKKMERICVRLWKSDTEKLRRISAGGVGFNNLVRTIVHSYVTQLEALERSKIDSIGPVDLSSLDLSFTLDELDLSFNEAGN